MASQDVKVKDVDAIRLYNNKFGEFCVAVSGHLQQLCQSLQQTQEEFRRSLREIKRECEAINEEIRDARDEYDYLNANREVVDYSLIMESRKKLEHLTGYVKHHAQNCEGKGWDIVSRSTQMFNLIEQSAHQLETNLQIYVERGKVYLDKAVLYIEQYKETQLNKD